MTKNKNTSIAITIVALLAVVALSCGFFLSQYMHRPPKIDMSQFHGTWLEKPREVSHFSLTGTAGPLNHDSLLGHWTMMFFGFTTCPSICPTTMVELAKMTKILEEQGVKTLPNVVLVSLDPKRDSIKKLNKYVTAFNPHFLGARSKNEAVVKVFAKEMGVAYTKITSKEDGNGQAYSIEHSGTVMLFNPEGQLAAFFTMPHQAASLAEDYRLALSTSPKLG